MDRSFFVYTEGLCSLGGGDGRPKFFEESKATKKEAINYTQLLLKLPKKILTFP
jgi:hypothetical protein